jgi:hypothetical protein
MMKPMPGHLTPEQLDEILDQGAPDAVAFHLETCQPCRDLVATERRLIEAISTLPSQSPAPTFADGIMARVALTHPEFSRARPHISPEEVDALLEGTLAQARVWHIEDCDPCLTLARAEEELVARLRQLPLHSPAPRFGRRVMAGVDVPETTGTLTVIRRRLQANPRGALVAASIGGVLLAGAAGSVAWTLGNRDLLSAWGQEMGATASQWLWLALRGTVSNVIEQPWYSAVTGLASSGARLATVGAAALTLYLGGLVALRRLLMLPAGQGPGARGR